MGSILSMSSRNAINALPDNRFGAIQTSFRVFVSTSECRELNLQTAFVDQIVEDGSKIPMITEITESPNFECNLSELINAANLFGYNNSLKKNTGEVSHIICDKIGHIWHSNLDGKTLEAYNLFLLLLHLNFKKCALSFSGDYISSILFLTDSRLQNKQLSMLQLYFSLLKEKPISYEYITRKGLRFDYLDEFFKNYIGEKDSLIR